MKEIFNKKEKQHNTELRKPATTSDWMNERTNERTSINLMEAPQLLLLILVHVGILTLMTN